MTQKYFQSILINNISETALRAVSEKKIFFGHNSVGFNILDGVNDILKEHPGVKLNIIKTHETAQFNAPIFAHFTLGQNGSPESKIDDFSGYLNSGIGNNAEIAFFKFCYLDIIATTDIDAIFHGYQKTMENLKREYPKTKFVHTTVPLTVSKPSLTSLIKFLLGKQDNNINRNLFNDKLLHEYEGKEPIFDISKVESTYSDGSRVTFTDRGRIYYALAPEYTDDGGHLNEAGRKIAAKELLNFLANITRK